MKNFKQLRKIERPPFVGKLKVSSRLFDVLFTEEMTSLLGKIDEEYYYWDKVKYQALPHGLNAKDIWFIVKARRKNTPYKVGFGKYKFYWNLNSKLQGALHFLDMNIGGSLESSSIIAKEDKHRYLLSSIMEEAIASSQIEGAITTRKQAKEMLRKNMKPRNRSEQMIYNNYLTIKKILAIKDDPLNLENLLKIHLLVTTNTLASTKEEGHLRIDNDINVVDAADGSVVHHPPNTSELNELLSDVFNFFNNEDPRLFIHPIIKASIIHFMIGFIHPFADGNGRTSRALFYWYLLRRGYWLTEYLSISRLILRSKSQYARAFQYTELDENDVTYFVSYNIKAIKLAFQELREYISRKNEQKKQFMTNLGVNGITYRQTIILEWFINEPSILLTVKEVEQRLGVSNVTARTDLNELSKMQYLEVKKINKVSKGYIKGEKFNFIGVSERPKSKQQINTQQKRLF